VHQLFIDFKKAYDSVRREKIRRKLHKEELRDLYSLTNIGLCCFQNMNILRTKTGNVMKYTTFCRGIN
jgi:hypothetical protein